MANPVTDKLPHWKPDADSADSNNPQADDSSIFSASTGLDGNLRRIKSELRDQTLALDWVRYTTVNPGVNDLVAPSTTAPTVVDPNTPAQFLLDGDWTGFIAIGQRVQIWCDAGQVYGSINAIVFGASTTITVDLDQAVAITGLTEIRFGAWNPDKSSQPFGTGRGLPKNFGGTGNTTGQPSGAAGGDLGGSYPDPDVVAIQGVAVLPTAPNANDLLAFEGLTWSPQPIATVDPDVTARVKMLTSIGTSGYVELPTASGLLFVQWITGAPQNLVGNSGTVDLALPVPFPNTGLFAIVNAKLGTVAIPNIIANVDSFPDTSHVRVKWERTATGGINDGGVIFHVLVIGN